MATPQHHMRNPIIFVLGELGGEATKREVLDEIEARGLVTPDAEDRELVTSNEERWRNRAAWERNALVQEEILWAPRRGVWGLTDVGWELHDGLTPENSSAARTESAAGQASENNTNPPWTRDEVALALAVYVQAGCLNGGVLLGRDDPAIVGLSDRLKSLPLHPPSVRGSDFRNPVGVALKLANFRALERDVRTELGEPGAEELPVGMNAYSRLDRAVFSEFFNRWDDLAAEARSIEAATKLSPSLRQGAPVASNAPVDGGGAAEYEASPANGGTRTRTEAELVETYADHMTAAGHTVTGRHYRVAGESRVLRADLMLTELNTLVEAKASISRTALRLAIGQLFDYRRYENPEPSLALLLPERPPTEMQDLLTTLGIDSIWPAGTGFSDTRDGKLVS